MSEISWDRDSISAATGSARSELGSLNFNGSGGEGMDPEVSGALDEGDQASEEEVGKGEDAAENIDKGADGLEDGEKESSDKTDGIDTELSASDGSGGKGGDGAGGGSGEPKSQLSSALPSQQTAPSSGGGGMPQMPQMSPPSSGGGSGGGMPSLPQMTQADMAGAPNRNDLVNQLKEDGPGDKTGFSGDMSDDEKSKAVQELAQKIVGMDMPYTWGGGHGAEPGPSGGTRDGGVADQFGDYKKTGVDCSGLTRWITAEVYGVDPNGTSQSQYASGKPISAENARPGDMFFPDSAGRPPTHVQMYVGNGQVVEAQKSGTNIMFSPLKSGEFRRFAD